MDLLRTTDAIPAPGTCFPDRHRRTQHRHGALVHRIPAALPGGGHARHPHSQGAAPAPDPEPDGRISVLLTADDRHVYGLRHQLAAWTASPTNAWTAAVAPTIAHPWAAHTHHWTERPNSGNDLRAALAYILTH